MYFRIVAGATNGKKCLVIVLFLVCSQVSVPLLLLKYTSRAGIVVLYLSNREEFGVQECGMASRTIRSAISVPIDI